MAFENFPYSDFHALNLDWILKHLKAIEEYVKKISPADVEKYVNDLLTEWRDDGTLAALLENKQIDKAVRGWRGFNKGWKISKNGPILNMGYNKPVTASAWSKADDGEWYFHPQLNNGNTVFIEQATDMPINRASISGAPDQLFAVVQDVNYTPTRVQFVLGSPIEQTGKKFVARLQVTAERATPPQEPSQAANGDMAEIAKTYLNRRIEGREFYYGPNWTYKSTDLVNDIYGRALMECDTLVLMCLLGIPYEASPYVNTTPEATFNFSNIQVDPTGNYPWALRNRDMVQNLQNNGYNDRIVTAGAEAWYCWDHAYVFNNIASARKGDIALFRRLPSDNFDNVGHVGIIDQDPDGTLYVIHVTGGEWTDEKVLVRSRLVDEFFDIRPGRYKLEDMYFARIDTSAT